MTDSKLFEIVFIDMDGVLCDFIASAYQVHGKAYDKSTYPPGAWDIAGLWGISDEAFWKAIDKREEYFWGSLQPFQWMNEIFSEAREIGESVKILSSPHHSEYCYSGKFEWWKNRIPNDFELILCKSKHLLAGPRRLLIDDADHNVDAWRAAGGKAVLFPQPWNAACGAMDRPMFEVGMKIAALQDEALRSVKYKDYEKVEFSPILRDPWIGTRFSISGQASPCVSESLEIGNTICTPEFIETPLNETEIVPVESAVLAIDSAD
jgi:hypothetical protein